MSLLRLGLIPGLFIAITLTLGLGLLHFIKNDAAVAMLWPLNTDRIRVRPCKCDEIKVGSVVKLVRRLIATHFPALRGYDICLSVHNASSTVFASGATAHPDPRRRAYNINIHRAVLEDANLPESALAAILVHELEHINDLSSRSLAQLYDLWSRYRNEPGFACDYELLADWFALRKGVAPGLRIYRRWMIDHYRANVDPAALEPLLKVKRQRYYQPQEIESFERGNQKQLTRYDRDCF